MVGQADLTTLPVAPACRSGAGEKSPQAGTNMKAMSADSKRRGAQRKVLEMGYFTPCEHTRPMNAKPRILSPIDSLRGPGSNRGHHNHRSCALPTELSRRRCLLGRHQAEGNVGG